MPSPARIFAPPWMRCSACALALLPFPAVLAAVAIDPRRWCLLTATPLALCAFLAGLNALISGRPQKAFFAIAADVIRGRFRALHDSSRSQHCEA